MFKELLDRLANLSTSVNSVKKELEDAKKTIEVLNSQVASKNNEIESLKKQIIEKDALIESLNSQLKTCQINQVDLTQLESAIKSLEDILGA